MAGEVNNENYIVIQGWMLNNLDIKGNELLVYAIIYGFSQTEGQVFSGSLQYLANWTKSTKQGVSKNLKSLVEKGYIVKNDKYINGVKFCEYYATKFNGGMQQSLMGYTTEFNGGMQQSLTNNIVNNKNNNIINNKEEKYFDNDDLNNIFKEYLTVRKKLKAVNSERAIKTLIKSLEQYDNDTKYKMIENSIVNSWKSIYPLKENKATYKRVEQVPEWMNKNIKEVEASKEEIAEIENLLKDYDTDNKEIPQQVLDFETRRAALQEKLRSKYKKNASNTQ